MVAATGTMLVSLILNDANKSNNAFTKITSISMKRLIELLAPFSQCVSPLGGVSLTVRFVCALKLAFASQGSRQDTSLSCFNFGGTRLAQTRSLVSNTYTSNPETLISLMAPPALCLTTDK